MTENKFLVCLLFDPVYCVHGKARNQSNSYPEEAFNIKAWACNKQAFISSELLLAVEEEKERGREEEKEQMRERKEKWEAGCPPNIEARMVP